MPPANTIFALSSGAPPAAIAIIRLSGPAAYEAATALAGSLPAERTAGLRMLRDPETGEVLDEALLLHFGAGRSVTGEPLVELHCHGGRAVVAAVLAVLGRMAGLRAAEPGEFTRRALEHGRMDLNAVEGLSDLLQAETEAQRRAAISMYGGRFTARVEALQQTALRAAALVEAALDFSDEDDVGEDGLALVRRELEALSADLATELARPPVERLREGIRLVVAGPVNSGKSTLVNWLAGQDVAIVTDIAGTTRDVIEVPVQIGGRAFLLTDTAGLRLDASDPVERIGIERAQVAMARADVLLWLGDPNECPRTDALLVLSRCDRPETDANRPHDVAVSVHGDVGLEALLAEIEARADGVLPASADYLLSRRQREGLASARDAVVAAMASSDPLLVAEHLRDALKAFDRLTGRASTEDMLDSLFSGFCIGK